MKNFIGHLYRFCDQRATGAFALMLGAVFVFSIGFANSNAHQLDLQTAIVSYKSADYDTAIQLLSAIVADESADIEHRKDALRYLGRCYMAKRLTDKARDVVLELLELEPPIVEFDPDSESPALMKVYYEARKNMTGSYQVERADPGIKTMAIMDFQNSSIDQKEKFDPMEKGFSDLMINRLNGSTQLKVVERERIQWILDELKIQNQFNMKDAVRAGEQLGVHVVLFGSFIIVKKELWLSARLVKVESSEILLTEEVRGKVDDFFTLIDDLSRKVSRAIDEDVEVTAAEKSAKPNSLEAMIAYSEGLALLEKSEYDLAYEKFQDALKYDPKYTRARQKAESIKYLLLYSEG